MAIDASAVARVLGIDVAYKNLRSGGALYLPQRIAVIGQGATSGVYGATKFQATTAAEVGSKVGFGSPLHLAARQLLPANGDGVGTVPVTFYPLLDHGSGVAAAGAIAATGTQTKTASYRVSVNNVLSETFSLPAGTTAAQALPLLKTALDAVLEMPVVTGTGTGAVTLAAKWKGASGNGLTAAVLGDVHGITFTVTQPAGGLTNPSVAGALAQMGGVWETLVLNLLDIADAAALDALQAFGEGRWGELVRKPFVAFTGQTAATVAGATAVSSARPTDRVNAQLVSPGASDLPFVVAARQLARIAKVANNNPPTDYGSQAATGLVPGADGAQWDYAARDQAVKAGSSTIEVKDGVVSIGDVVTFYRPTGEEPPAFRYVVDIVKLQNILFNIDLLFSTPDWDGAPLIPDDQATVNPQARKPKSAAAEVAGMLDSLALNAIISDPKAAKASIAAGINAQNPKRLDIAFTAKLSGNANIKGITLGFGYYFGAQVAA